MHFQQVGVYMQHLTTGRMATNDKMKCDNEAVFDQL